MSDSEEEITERQFKIALVGDPEVGKTSIATRYASGIKVISCLENYTFSRSGIVSNQRCLWFSDTYVKQFTPTVGVEFYLKRTILPGPRHVTLKVTNFQFKDLVKLLNLLVNDPLFGLLPFIAFVKVGLLLYNFILYT